MPASRMTRADLEEENAMLRGRLAEARDLIDETLDLEEVDVDDDDEHEGENEEE